MFLHYLRLYFPTAQGKGVHDGQSKIAANAIRAAELKQLFMFIGCFSIWIFFTTPQPEVPNGPLTAGIPLTPNPVEVAKEASEQESGFIHERIHLYMGNLDTAPENVLALSKVEDRIILFDSKQRFDCNDVPGVGSHDSVSAHWNEATQNIDCSMRPGQCACDVCIANMARSKEEPQQPCLLGEAFTGKQKVLHMAFKRMKATGDNHEELFKAEIAYLNRGGPLGVANEPTAFVGYILKKGAENGSDLVRLAVVVQLPTAALQSKKTVDERGEKTIFAKGNVLIKIIPLFVQVPIIAGERLRYRAAGSVNVAAHQISVSMSSIKISTRMYNVARGDILPCEKMEVGTKGVEYSFTKKDLLASGLELS